MDNTSPLCLNPSDRSGCLGIEFVSFCVFPDLCGVHMTESFRALSWVLKCIPSCMDNTFPVCRDPYDRNGILGMEFGSLTRLF